MSFTIKSNVEIMSDLYGNFIIGQLLKLSDGGHIEDEEIIRLHNLISEYRYLREVSLSHFQSIWNKCSAEEREFLFHGVLEYLFENEINLRKVIVAFMLIMEVLRMTSQPERAHYYSSSFLFVLTRVNPWVQQHGGWGELCKFEILWGAVSYELDPDYNPDEVKLYKDIHSMINGLVSLSNGGHIEDEKINIMHSLITEGRKQKTDTLSHFQSIWNKCTVEERRYLFHWMLEFLFINGITLPRITVAFMFIIEVLNMSSKEERINNYGWSFMFVLTRVHPWLEEHVEFGENFDDYSFGD